MSRILLADDSAHAQRIGECILREEGFEVVSVTDGDTALVRLADVDPDVILASVQLPRKNGYEICRCVKEDARQRHTRVVLTAGALDPLDQEEARRVQADASLRKPFEATILLQTVKPLVEAAQREREQSAALTAPLGEIQGEPATIELVTEFACNRSLTVAARKCAVDSQQVTEPRASASGLSTSFAATSIVEVAPSVTEAPQEAPAAEPAQPDPELVRAAVTVALDTAFPSLVEEITSRVLASLKG